MEEMKETAGMGETSEKKEEEDAKTEEVPAEEQPVKSKRKKYILSGFIIAAVLLAGIGAYVFVKVLPLRGYQDYTVRKEQYFVEYSDQYDYWDVLTVEYPRLEDIDEAQMEQVNKQLYDTAMDRINYWHLEPDEEMRKLQEEYHIFCSDVRCDVTYHSQYLLSVDYHEIYAPISPVYYANITERALNVDMMTGEVYELSDIFTIDEEFIDLWCRSANKEYGESVPYDEETCNILLMWFLREDEELKGYYEIQPFFYITPEKEFVIGIALDPTIRGLTYSAPDGNFYSTLLTEEELESYRTESEFWNKYAKSRDAGEVLECEELKENIWLGEDAGVWDYWEER